ncbi:MAG TPA: S-layer homology domain-containing protein [Candidatus Ornithomonoglobus intestinigallinarum]|uniref:S-layer homology domain-containing protein n=1 Tax=Candidatus Ornithomonoglobus intestinigallinarum TaxID=2840894 RepID=A0A9D1KPH1_9FIRM|nr:S-layer homology domain-containing protein [Candidatus Ornithomonoglobus intestinigallinarum]
MKKLMAYITACSLLMTGISAFAADETFDGDEQVYDMAGENELTVEVPDGDYTVTVTLGSDTDTQATVYINGGARIKSASLEAGEDMTQEQPAVPDNGTITVTAESEVSVLKEIKIERIPEREAGEYPAIYIAGDSTAQTYNYDTAYPQTGWGQVFADYFTDETDVRNISIGGRSTKSFRNDGRLDRILTQIRPGDYLFIQFGINDGAVDKPERYTSIEDYKKLLTDYYIGETIKRGATPILLTPTAAAWWDGENGRFMESRQDYAVPTREVAEETGVDFIDINQIMYDTYNAPFDSETLGDAEKEQWKNDIRSGYFICEPLESKAYPEGTNDETHLKEKGARRIAKMIAGEVKENIDGLGDYVVLERRFDDISDHWAEDFINAYADNLNLKGRNGSSFEPESEVTRAELLKMVMDACGIAGHAYREDECLDTAADAWYRFYLQGALDKGIIPAEMAEGCTGTETQTKTITEATEESEAVTADITVYTGGKSFNGDTPITRGEAAAVVYGCIKAAAGDELEIPAEQQGDFADEDEIPAEYLDAVKALRALNILYGYDDGEFKADKTITRAEAVKLASEASGYCGFAELEALTAAQQG